MTDATALKLLATQAAIEKMFSGSYFDICTIDNVVKMMGLKPDREAYQILRTLHCVHYNQMPRELIEELPMLIHRVLTSPALESSRLNIVSDSHGLAVIRH